MLDIIVVIVLVLFLLYGIRTGLVRMALRMGAVLLSILLAWLLYPIVSEVFSNFFLESLSQVIQENYIAPNLDGMLGSAEGVPVFLQGFLQSGAEAAMQTAAESMSDSVAGLILNVAAFLTVFLFSRLVLLLLTHVLDVITRLPLIKQCNKLGGGVLGFLEGGLAVYMILAVVFLIAPIRDSEMFQQQMQNSVITRQMYNNNMIIKMVAPNSVPETEKEA